MNVNFAPRSNSLSTTTGSTVKWDDIQQNRLTPTRSQDTITISAKSEQELEYTKSTDRSPTSPETADSTGTSFEAFNPVAKLVKYAKVVKEYYSRQNEENKKFANPDQHIWRKYNDRSYPHYVKGLTERERQISMEQERCVLMGKEPAINNYDPVIQRTFGGINSFEADIDYTQEYREQLNDTINQIFKENGITIPDGTDLRLTVDPYDFKIHAEGVDDELAQRIESALNTGKNGSHLYGHIDYCNPANLGLPAPSQYSSGGSFKTSVFHIVKELTGYDLRKMENKDGKFYTPDGRDVWDVVTEKYNELCKKEGVDSLPSFKIDDANYGAYQHLARFGWDSYSDANLTIGYQDGSLYDIDTPYGYGKGQTEWLDNLKDQFKKDQEKYRAQRDEILRKEEAGPNKLEQLYMRMGADVPEDESSKKIGLYGKDGTFYPIHPVSDEVMDRLNYIFKLSSGALTNKVLSIQNKSSYVRRSINFMA